MKFSELIDRTNQILTRRFIETDSLTLTKDSILTTALSREIGEKVESRLRSTSRDDERDRFSRVKPDSTINNSRQDERMIELHQSYKEHLSERSYVR